MTLVVESEATTLGTAKDFPAISDTVEPDGLEAESRCALNT